MLTYSDIVSFSNSSSILLLVELEGFLSGYLLESLNYKDAPREVSPFSAHHYFFCKHNLHKSEIAVFIVE